MSDQRWEIAVDLYPRKPNGDRLVRKQDRARREWYVAHPEAWRIVEVGEIGTIEQRTENDLVRQGKRQGYCPTCGEPME